MTLAPPPRVKPVWDFAIHIATGAVAFLIVLLVAVVLAGAVKFVQGLGFVPDWLIRTFEYAEMFMFGIDALLFSLFFLREAFTLSQSLLRASENADG